MTGRAVRSSIPTRVVVSTDALVGARFVQDIVVRRTVLEPLAWWVAVERIAENV